ncbi:5-methyltetrahydropteroyltriglutamate--homocysteine methyltransferase [Maritimibacter alkaliphilus HTCC2654]|uniref:Putative epoxyalkane:coenzyme M transferase n=1 Tax=Maritimibacter alkaliphilus HTCC2654 TaxID=314271 RepID=A3VMR3_9RHOB|nr:cobalamin-independent methionine synthase II family protein [Maritimibacter alkaliphilus]EAQ10445.1 putative epoxyalkane:coenzyme M transferase [Rhodobacterales bacterium HTCC2654] [Maritimibacter alkaliphilus HTCC2654]TYP83188.1 5-methyltetrahydropteroyltriglutamate--homocysteine methyltransferase [Maritimibacter alkaliphilus HTCC2654]
MTIETTHVGSLPRGDALSALLIAKDKGEAYDAEAFEATVEEAIRDAIRHQREAGVSIVSDGELGKVGYSTYMQERLSGFGGHIDRKPAKDLAAHPNLAKKLSAIMGSQEFTRASCIGEVKLVDLQPALDDIRRFKEALGAEADTGRAFMNAASPGLITAFQVNKYYPSHEAYLADLAAAMRPEYEAILDAGFDIQFDCPDLAMSAHTGYQDMDQEEFVKVAAANVEALNAATEGLPKDRMRMHLCWGNYEGPHDHDIPLEKVIDVVLSANPSTILFESANPCHEHEWTVWRDADIPDDKVLAPGVIDTCSNYVEHPELVAQRLGRFIDIVGEDRVIASTDCGFGTFAGYGKIDPEVTWKKLRNLRQGADIASAR